MKKYNGKSMYGATIGDKDTGSQNLGTYASLLDFKLLEELPVAKILCDVSLEFIENWVELEKDKNYVELAMRTLHSIFSHVRVNLPETTENQSKMRAFSSQEKFENFRVDKVDA